jgi:hypothetical protein
VGKPERNKHLEVRRRYEDNIKINFEEIRCGMDWIDLARNRDKWRAVVNTVMNLAIGTGGGLL